MKIQRWDKGFTIIEVLIVLAIAGLILIIIFLAVPALERNSRNTQRKHDAAFLAANIGNFKSTNGNLWLNRLQTDASDPSSIDIFSSTDPTNYQSIKLGFYGTSGSSGNNNAGKIYINPANPTPGLNSLKTPNVVASGTAADQNHVDDTTMVIFSGETCDDAGDAAGTLQTNAVAVFYVTENGSNNGDVHCLGAY